MAVKLGVDNLGWTTTPIDHSELCLSSQQFILSEASRCDRSPEGGGMEVSNVALIKSNSTSMHKPIIHKTNDLSSINSNDLI